MYRVSEAHTTLLATWTARYWPLSDLLLVLKPLQSALAGVGVVLYADHVRFDLSHPYNKIEHLPML